MVRISSKIPADEGEAQTELFIVYVDNETSGNRVLSDLDRAKRWAAQQEIAKQLVDAENESCEKCQTRRTSSSCKNIHACYVRLYRDGGEPGLEPEKR